MKVFTKRNAVVGYLTLRSYSHARRRWTRRQQKRSGLRLVMLLALGLVSVGVLAALAAILFRRQEEGAGEITDEITDTPGDHIDGPEIADDLMPSVEHEPIPAT